MQKLRKVADANNALHAGESDFFGKAVTNDYVWGYHPKKGIQMRAHVLGYDVQKKNESDLLGLGGLTSVLTVEASPKLVLWGTYCIPERDSLDVLDKYSDAQVPKNSHLSFCQTVGDPVLSYTVDAHIMYFDSQQKWCRAVIGAVEEAYFLIKHDAGNEFVPKNSKRIRAETFQETADRELIEKEARQLLHKEEHPDSSNSSLDESVSELGEEKKIPKETQCWNALKIRHYVRAISRDNSSWIPARIVKKTTNHLWCRYYDMSYQLSDDIGANLLLQDSHTKAYSGHFSGTVMFWNQQKGQGEITLDIPDHRYPRKITFSVADILGPQIGDLFLPCRTVLITPFESKKKNHHRQLDRDKIKFACEQAFEHCGAIESCDVRMYTKNTKEKAKSYDEREGTKTWFARVTFQPGKGHAWEPACNAVTWKSPEIKVFNDGKGVSSLVPVKVMVSYAILTAEEKKCKKVSFAIMLAEGSKGYVAKDVIRINDPSMPILKIDRASGIKHNSNLIMNYDEPPAHAKFHAMYNYVRKFHERHMSVKFIPAEDSDSLYQAISHQLFGTVSNAAFLKRKCVEHLRKHSEYFRKFVDIDFEYYLTRKSQEDEPSLGDHLDIQAICEMYDVQAEIYYEPGAFLKGDSITQMNFDEWKVKKYFSDSEEESVSVPTSESEIISEDEVSEDDDEASSEPEHDLEPVSLSAPSSSANSSDFDDEETKQTHHLASMQRMGEAHAKKLESKKPTTKKEDAYFGKRKRKKAENKAKQAEERMTKRADLLKKLSVRRKHLPEVFFYTDLALPYTIHLSYNGGHHYDSVYKVYDPLPLPVVGRNIEYKVLAARQKEEQNMVGAYDEDQKDKAERDIEDQTKKNSNVLFRCLGLFGR